MAHHIRKSVKAGPVQSRINITPLIDILLVLIVIFMVVTPVTPKGQNAEIPKESSSPERPQGPMPAALVLDVGPGGVITLNHNPVQSTADLTFQLQDIFKNRSDRTIFIQGSRDLEFDGIVQVIDAARGGGANRIGLLTEEIR